MWQYCPYFLILILIISSTVVQNLPELIQQDATPQSWVEKLYCMRSLVIHLVCDEDNDRPSNLENNARLASRFVNIGRGK